VNDLLKEMPVLATCHERGYVDFTEPAAARMANHWYWQQV